MHPGRKCVTSAHIVPIEIAHSPNLIGGLTWSKNKSSFVLALDPV